ncbi:uncharacterized protein JCM6883_001228 [Sporobolomyces salmoneus]|uniref:uncharacterized protein n=1 Tax=Sporobolomyces salmoneus TaxID=183962 RepID=UPI00316E6281
MSTASKDASTTIYVGGFSEETTSAAIHAAFHPFGEILELQLPPDPTSKSRHRGFAFVTYSNPEATLDAIDNMHRNILPGVTNKGKPLKVNRAKPQKGNQKGGASNKPIWANEEWLQEHGVAPVQTEAGKALPPTEGAED